MAESLAGSRGPLGNLAVDLIKQTILVSSGTPFISVIDPELGDRFPLTAPGSQQFNDWGGELRFSHVRLSARPGYPIIDVDQGFDGITYLDIQVDGVSVFPPDPITGVRDYIKIDASVLGPLVSDDGINWRTAGPLDESFTRVIRFDGSLGTWPNGSTVTLAGVTGPSTVSNGLSVDQTDNSAAQIDSFVLYSYPTGG